MKFAAVHVDGLRLDAFVGLENLEQTAVNRQREVGVYRVVPRRKMIRTAVHGKICVRVDGILRRSEGEHPAVQDHIAVGFERLEARDGVFIRRFFGFRGRIPSPAEEAASAAPAHVIRMRFRVFRAAARVYEKLETVRVVRLQGSRSGNAVAVRDDHKVPAGEKNLREDRIGLVFRMDAVFRSGDTVCAVRNRDRGFRNDTVSLRCGDSQTAAAVQQESRFRVDAFFPREGIRTSFRKGDGHVPGGPDVNCRLAGGGNLRTVEDEGHVIRSRVHGDHAVVRTGEPVFAALRDTQAFRRRRDARCGFRVSGLCKFRSFCRFCFRRCCFRVRFCRAGGQQDSKKYRRQNKFPFH